MSLYINSEEICYNSQLLDQKWDEDKTQGCVCWFLLFDQSLKQCYSHGG